MLPDKLKQLCKKWSNIVILFKMAFFLQKNGRFGRICNSRICCYSEYWLSLKSSIFGKIRILVHFFLTYLPFKRHVGRLIGSMLQIGETSNLPDYLCVTVIPGSARLNWAKPISARRSEASQLKMLNSYIVFELLTPPFDILDGCCLWLFP